MTVSPVLDAAGRRRSPATMPGYHAGRAPRNKGLRYPADPPTVEEIHRGHARGRRRPTWLQAARADRGALARRARGSTATNSRCLLEPATASTTNAIVPRIRPRLSPRGQTSSAVRASSAAHAWLSVTDAVVKHCSSRSLLRAGRPGAGSAGARAAAVCAADAGAAAGGAAARREFCPSGGGDLPAAGRARAGQHEALSVQQPERRGDQIAAAMPRVAAQGGDLAGADGLALMRVLGVSERAQHGPLLTGHAPNANGPSGCGAGSPAPVWHPRTQHDDPSSGPIEERWRRSQERRRR